MSGNEIGKQFLEMQAAVAQAVVAAGRPARSARLLAVSKTVPQDLVMDSYAAGAREFGESRPQELAEKAAKLPADCIWHMIGHLQANKVRPVVRCAAWIHSVDSLDLLQRIDRIAGEEGKRPSVLFEVNVSGEESKFGLAPSAVPALVEAGLACANLRLAGLMTMAPYDAPETELRKIFGGLRQLRDELQARFNIQLPELSMGMSGDFPIAVAEGATIVRIGTAIFGERG
jgi:pyridoxal phosphate enzyme (YggS family)